MLHDTKSKFDLSLSCLKKSSPAPKSLIPGEKASHVI